MSRPLSVQLGRFLVVGTCTVAVDFAVYQGLLALSVPVNVSKATSFVVATILAYVLNRLWTFGAPGGPGRALMFAGLYATTLIVNVAVNAVVLDLLDGVRWHVEIAFVCAQACSTTINFVLMRQVVFAVPSPEVARDAQESPPAARGTSPGQRA